MARTTTTALLRSYRNRKEEAQDWEDQLLDYEWSLSLKTKQDWDSYKAHYENRQTVAENDPKAQLSYQKKIDSGFRAFSSNEIQRASIDVIEGGSTEEQKLNKLTDLYLQAYGLGNYDLAQQLRLQVDNQIVKIQQAQQAALTGGGYGGGGGSTSADKALKAQVTAAISDFKKGAMPIALGNGETLTVADISNLVKTKGEDGLNQLANQLGYTDAQSGMEMLKDIIGSQIGELQQYASQITDPATVADINNQISKLQSTKLDIAGGDGSNTYTISYEDIVNELNGRANGNGRFTFAPNGEKGFDFVEYSAQDIITGNNQLGYDSEGNPIFRSQYGVTSTAKEDFNYEPGQDMVYELKDGVMKAVPWNQLTPQQQEQSQKSGKSIGKNLYRAGDIFKLAGLKEVDGGNYQVSPGMIKILKDSGFNIDSNGLIRKDAIVFDRVTGLPEMISPDGRSSVIWKAEGDRLAPTVRAAVTGQQYLSEQGYDANGQPTSSLDSLGYNKMNASGLQPAAGAALLQAQKGGQFVQPGGISGMLQQTANASMINSINAKELEQIRVKELERQKQKLAVQNFTAPQITGVVNREPIVAGFAVKPYTPPTLGKVTTAPSTSMTSGGTSLQGGTTSLQGGGSSWLYGGSGGLSVTQSGGGFNLKVR